MTTPDLNVTLVQPDIVWESPRENRHHVDALLADSADTDLIVLPEMFSTGFSMHPEPIAEQMSGATVAWMHALADEKQCTVMGSLIIEEAGCYYNRLVVVDEQDNLAYYDKKYLFSFAGENNAYTPGHERLRVNVKGWNIAPFICFDLRFPEWARNVDGQYDLAIYVASWPANRRTHWQTLLQARAIENQAYVVGVNRVGVDGNGHEYVGDTMVIDALGEVLVHEMEKEQVVQYTMSYDALNTIKETMPFLKEID